MGPTPVQSGSLLESAVKPRRAAGDNVEDRPSDETGQMGLRTIFTELLQIEHPIALAPMGGAAGGALAAAVSNGGGLGLVGAARSDFEWIDREVAQLGRLTDKPWGIGFQTWSITEEAVKRALDFGPSAIMLSFGDPQSVARPVTASDALLIIQVVDLDEARRAVDAGADMIVAQGAEAGGHGGTRSTLPFVPAVVDLVRPLPVLAAGGIADGRGLAAALSLGAVGVLVGTRFQACAEALVDPEVLKAIVHGKAEDTERSQLLDIARGVPWPDRYTARTLRNDFLDQWRDRPDELRADAAAIAAYRLAEDRGDMRVVPVWAGEGIDLITECLPAADVVRIMAAEAEAALRRIFG
jgi:nitronate monooxygenase